MAFLTFKDLIKSNRYIILGDENIFLLNGEEYSQLANSNTQEVLKSASRISKNKIVKIIVKKWSKEIHLFDIENKQVLKIKFESRDLRNRFLKGFHDLSLENTQTTSRLNPLLAIILMLVSYGFLWAGTKNDISELNPEGIKFRIPYNIVQVFHQLTLNIGQQKMLIVGIILTCIFFYLIFKPELFKLTENKLIYTKTSNQNLI